MFFELRAARIVINYVNNVNLLTIHSSYEDLIKPTLS